MLEVNYAYLNQSDTSKNEYFLVDIIDFKQFDGFLASIQKDVDEVGYCLMVDQDKYTALDEIRSG